MLFQDVIIFLPVSIFFKISRKSYPSRYSYIEFTGTNSTVVWLGLGTTLTREQLSLMLSRYQMRTQVIDSM